jgi:hypothetical protein
MVEKSCNASLFDMLKYNLLHIFFVLPHIKSVNESTNSQYMLVFCCVLFYVFAIAKMTDSSIRLVFWEIHSKNWETDQIDSQIPLNRVQIHEFVIFPIAERENETQWHDNIYRKLLLWLPRFTRLKITKAWRKSYSNMRKSETLQDFSTNYIW